MNNDYRMALYFPLQICIHLINQSYYEIVILRGIHLWQAGPQLFQLSSGLGTLLVSLKRLHHRV